MAEVHEIDDFLEELQKPRFAISLKSEVAREGCIIEPNEGETLEEVVEDAKVEDVKEFAADRFNEKKFEPEDFHVVQTSGKRVESDYL